MSNMTVNQRAQYERVDLSVPSTGVQVRHRRAVIAYSVIAAVLVGAMTYATITLIDGWARAIVFGVIILTAVGAMIAVSPNRRA